MARKKAEKEIVELSEEEQPYELPEGWKWEYISNVSTVVTGSTPSKKKIEYYSDKEGFPFFKPADLDSGRHLYNPSEYLSDEGKNISRVIPHGSTLICCIGTIGKSAYMEVDGTTNQQINAVIPNINNLYMYYYSNSDTFINQLLDKASAITISIVNKSKLESCYIPIPSKETQQKIVDVIESLFDKLDIAQEKVEQVLAESENRRATILHNAFSGRLTEKWRKENGVSFDTWQEIKLESLGTLERGRSKHRPRNDERLFGGIYPFIQTGDISNANVYIQSHNQTLSEFGLQQSKLFTKGTLCITIAANIGNVAILTYDCCFPDSVVGFTPNEKSDSKFMYYTISYMRNDIETNAPAVAQKNINLKMLNSLMINTPTLLEQKEIVRLLDKFLSVEDKIKSTCQSTLETIATMRKSILAKAFRGELCS